MAIGWKSQSCLCAGQTHVHTPTYIMVWASQQIPVIPIILFLATVSVALLFFCIVPLSSCLNFHAIRVAHSLWAWCCLSLSLSGCFFPFSYALLVLARMSGRCLLQMPSCSWKAVVTIAWQAAWVLVLTFFVCLFSLFFSLPFSYVCIRVHAMTGVEE